MYRRAVHTWRVFTSELGLVPCQVCSPALPGTSDVIVTAHRVEHLRHLMAEAGVSAYLIPSSDPHMSEYTPERYMQRGYITGFDGSFGFVVVTQKEALLWTDGRYFLQASQQLESPVWTLMKGGQPGVPTSHDWVAANMDAGAVVGFDPWYPSCMPVRPCLFAQALPLCRPLRVMKPLAAGTCSSVGRWGLIPTIHSFSNWSCMKDLWLWM